ncbi:HalOD1 output domain-containing protein [Halalkalicoccus tibetensis]|uniref:HalOD1 output domain-containing protein n=1 Tax=Halalkalicoccus tibetensis TaxID=175632 RepID=A0ABD5V1Q3_9EURY
MTDDIQYETAHRTDGEERRAFRTLERGPGDGPIHPVVVEVVGSLLDVSPGDLDPMFDSLDTEALDALCRADPDARLRVGFVYHGCSVAIRCEGATVHVSASAPSRGSGPDPRQTT